MLEPLPLPWVQRIFAKLTVRYGTAFRTRYAGIDEDELWADWAEQLAGFKDRPEAITHALDYLPPDHPPTATAFRDLCRRAPVMAAPALESPKCTPDPAVMAKAAQAVKARGAHNPRGWAWALARKELWQQQNPRDVAARDALTQAQRTMWRQALDVGTAVTAAEVLAEQVPA